MASTNLEIKINASGNAAEEIGKTEDALAGLGESAKQLAGAAQMEALRMVGADTVQVFKALGSVGGEWVNMAAEAELVGAKLDAQLAAMGDSAAVTRGEMDALANELSKVTMFEDESVLAAQGILLRFEQINKETFPDAIRLSADLATTLGTDITSAAQTLGMALEDPIGALGRLRRAGIMFTDEQQAMIKGMVEAGDQAGAQAMILEVLEGKIGGVAEAAGQTFAGKMAIAKTAADNFRESIGQGFINAFGALPVPIQTASLVIQSFGGDIMKVAGPVVQLLGSLAQLKAVGGIGGLTTVFGGLSTAFTTAATSAWAMLAPILAAAAPFLLLAAAVGLLVFVIKNFGAEAWNTVEMLAQLVGASLEELGRRLGVFVDDMKTWMVQSANSLVDWAKGFVNVGRAIVLGIWDGIQSGWQWLITNVQNLAISLLNAAKWALGIGSPSKAFAEQIGKPAAEGVAVGFQSAMPAVTNSIGRSLAPVPAQSTRGMGFAGGGGGGVTVVYSPNFSAANAKEFETLLVPLIDRQLSLNQRRRV